MPQDLPAANIKISQIRCFVAVVEERGFNAAAQRLFRSQPAVSIAVKELEKQLGAPLFESGTGSQPSLYGETFYRIARRLLDEYDRSVRQALEAASGQKGFLRFVSVPSLARSVLPQAIALFVGRHPHVDVHISDGHTEYVRDAVLSGEADFGFCGHVAPDSRLSFEEIHSDRMGVVCSRRSALADLRETSWESLGRERLIGNGTMRLIDESARQHIQHASRFFITNTTSLLAVVQTNVGVTILPELVFPADPSISLSFVPLVEPEVRRQLGLLTLANRSLSPVGQIFYKYVLSVLREMRSS